MHHEPLPLNSWKPARLYPLTYPGECPDGSYLILNDEVVNLQANRLEDIFFIREEKKYSLNDWLKKKKIAPLEERIMVVAYGANRNPATLKIKFENYQYQYLDQHVVVPVLKGRLKHADVVASGLHGQGYFFGDLLLESPHTKGTEIDVWINLLDEDQFRVIAESENVSSGMYILGQIDEVTLSESDVKTAVVGFISTSASMIYSQTSTPVAFKNVKATGRKISAMSTTEMLEKFTMDLALIEEVRKITQIPFNSNFAFEFSSYLNRRWWQKFNGIEFDERPYTTILNLFSEAILSRKTEKTTAAYLNKSGKIVNQDAALFGNTFKFNF